MKKKLFITISVIVIGLSACKKNESGTTPVNPNLPALTTTAVSVITTNSAKGGGRVTSEGIDSVTARGICWSTTQSPTIAATKTTNGSDTGTFTSVMTSLTPNTTYYVR